MSALSWLLAWPPPHLALLTTETARQTSVRDKAEAVAAAAPEEEEEKEEEEEEEEGRRQAAKWETSSAFAIWSMCKQEASPAFHLQLHGKARLLLSPSLPPPLGTNVSPSSWKSSSATPSSLISIFEICVTHGKKRTDGRLVLGILEEIARMIATVIA